MGDLGLREVSGDIFQKDSLTGPTYSGPPAKEKKSLLGVAESSSLAVLGR